MPEYIQDIQVSAPKNSSPSCQLSLDHIGRSWFYVYVVERVGTVLDTMSPIIGTAQGASVVVAYD